MNGEGESNLIKLSVEGIRDENGHFRFDEFLQKLQDLLVALNGIDRLVGNTFQPTLYYRVIKVTQSSPLSMTLEPVVKAEMPIRQAEQHIRVRHNRFFHELDSIKRSVPISPDIDEYLLQRFESLAEGRGRSFAKVSISNSEASIDLDETFETNVRKLLAEEDCSYGGAEGRLDAVNIHGATPKFWIYPRIGAERIKCDFLPGTSEQIREALGKYIRVLGLKYFRSQSPYPYRIAVKEFEIQERDDDDSLLKLRGIAPEATGELSSVEFVRAIRNEWD
jgi:hypothetical protein